MTEKFWIVWRPGHDPAPSKRHTSLLSARSEAIRLARKEPPAPFYVLELVGVAQIPQLPDVTWSDAVTTLGPGQSYAARNCYDPREHPWAWLDQWPKL